MGSRPASGQRGGQRIPYGEAQQRCRRRVSQGVDGLEIGEGCLDQVGVGAVHHQHQGVVGGQRSERLQSPEIVGARARSEHGDRGGGVEQPGWIRERGGLQRADAELAREGVAEIAAVRGAERYGEASGVGSVISRPIDREGGPS